MPNTKWSELSHLQLGRYAEYYAKMEFASYGYDVYTSEVDDHGVDFVARNPDDGQYYEIQVKAVRNLDYVYIRKDKMVLSPARLVYLLLFSNGTMPTGSRYCSLTKAYRRKSRTNYCPTNCGMNATLS